LVRTFLLRLLRDRNGGSAIEFALIGMFLLTLLFGIIAFGLQFGTRILAVQAAAEGARAAAIGLTAAERETLARAAATATLNSYGSIARVRTIGITVEGTPPTRVAVTVSIDLSAFRLDRLTAFVPAMATAPSATASVQVGGF
jgi:Flp pilus assembly protein TadG